MYCDRGKELYIKIDNIILNSFLRTPELDPNHINVDKQCLSVLAHTHTKSKST